MRTWSKAFILALLGLLSIVAPLRIASADNGSGTFKFLVGTGLLCSLGVPNACPDVSSDPSGDMVQIAGQGTLSIHANSVSGSGTFKHLAPDGTVKAAGTWTALQLMSFNSFGTSPSLPANFLGGKAVILVQLSVGGTPVHTGVLTVICDVGNPPHGLMEGFKLVVQDTPFNFNKQVSGITLFIAQT